jgi:WD repeat-containing protein 44
MEEVDHREEEEVDLLYESLDRILSSSTSSISASDDNGADNPCCYQGYEAPVAVTTASASLDLWTS